ncbi:MAG: carbohydrate ABC transporter permease [Pseudomonadota bacterium]
MSARVIIFAAIAGAIWGGVWMIIVGVLLMLVSGLTLTPQVGLAALIGLGAGALWLWLPDKFRNDRPIFFPPTIWLLVLLLALSLAQPFSVPMSQSAAYQGAAAALWAVAVSSCLRLTLAGYNQEAVSRYRFEVLVIRLLKGLGFIIFTILVVLPFYVMLMTSLKSQQSLLANPLDFSIDVSQGAAKLFRSYIELFTDYDFGTFLLNSAIVSVATVIITLAFAIPGAYAVARLRFRGQAFLSRSILLIYMVPAIVLVIPLYAVFSQLGLRNSLIGLLVVYPATTIPVALYMLQGYFRGLPSELEEAGLMDGLTRAGVIAQITLPLSLPALASVALYVFMIAWNEFLFAFMFLDDLEMFTLSRGVVSLNSSEVPRQHLMAGAVVATVPVLAIFLWFERYLVSGLTAGSVKG